jgi:hypothetical protein
MNQAKNHDERMAAMTFATVYPLYLAKIERKGRTKAELHEVIEWLTGYDETAMKKQVANQSTFEQFFQLAKLNPNAQLITGLICGYRIEEIKNPLTQKVRFLDKLVDELAQGREMRKILRVGEPTVKAKKALASRRAAPTEAETQLRALISQFAPSHVRLIGAVRRWLQKRLPTAHELVYKYRDHFVISYSPSEHGNEGVLAIQASANGVKLYWNSAKDLPDPAKLLQGSGKQTRWMVLPSASTLARPEVLRLIDEAIARNTVPFAVAGHGSLVIRSTTAQKRRPA